MKPVLQPNYSKQRRFKPGIKKATELVVFNLDDVNFFAIYVDEH